MHKVQSRPTSFQGFLKNLCKCHNSSVHKNKTEKGQSANCRQLFHQCIIALVMIQVVQPPQQGNDLHIHAHTLRCFSGQ